MVLGILNPVMVCGILDENSCLSKVWKFSYFQKLLTKVTSVKKIQILFGRIKAKGYFPFNYGL